jgi:hypothetical protein
MKSGAYDIPGLEVDVAGAFLDGRLEDLDHTVGLRINDKPTALSLKIIPLGGSGPTLIFGPNGGFTP